MYFTLLSSAMKGNALFVERSSGGTLLRRIGSGCLKSAISGVRKMSRIRASISSLVKRSVNRTMSRGNTKCKNSSRKAPAKVECNPEKNYYYQYHLTFRVITRACQICTAVIGQILEASK